MFREYGSRASQLRSISLGILYQHKIYYMRSTLYLSLCYLFVFSTILVSCKPASKEETRSFKTDFEAIDNQANSFSVHVRGRIKISSDQLENLEKEYGSRSIETFLFPFIRYNTRDILMNYSASEIYKYRRSEIELEITKALRLELKAHNIVLISFNFSSINLPDDLYQRLLKEHIESKDQISD